MSMLTTSLTERQRREAEYYAQYVQLHQVREVDFEPIISNRPRPWSPYWFVCGLVRQRFEAGARTLLDFGCGNGVTGVTFARLGFEVCGFDIAQGNVDSANRLARQYGQVERCQFRVGLAEQLAYPDQHFDLVVGMDILHHVDIPKALAEVRRVLKPDGVAIFKEPFEVPLLDRLRHSRPLLLLAPKTRSLDAHVHITDDERKLNQTDFRHLHAAFSQVTVTHFSILTRLYRLLSGRLVRFFPLLMRLDYSLMRIVPLLRGLGDVRVFVCHK